MHDTLLLDPVRILHGPGTELQQGAALIESGVLSGFGDGARTAAAQLGIQATTAPQQLLAPCLVDPHTVLPSPISGPTETIRSLRRCAAAGGYGQVALLPRGQSWRDQPERLIGLQNADPSSVHLPLWGGFSLNGKGDELAPHGDLLEHGAIGLADDDAVVPLPLLERGLLLGEMGSCPVLIAPRDPNLQGDGLAREGVETLRAGWAPDPLISELLPLQQLLALQQRHPDRQLRLMNISTAAAVDLLGQADPQLKASVCWWHLLVDGSSLSSTDPGCRVRPSLGGAADRLRLRSALQSGLIQAVAVHAVPLDEEDMLLPADQRPPGLSGHHLVLPALWSALVDQGDLSIESLWELLSFGPSAFLDQPAESLLIGSRRWLLFDPEISWTVSRDDPAAPGAANLPWLGRTLQGRVVACGLSR